MTEKEILNNYKKKGFVVIKNFFKKKHIKRTKKNILDSSKKINSELFFFEKNKNVLRRIENVSSFSKDANKIILDKKL